MPQKNLQTKKISRDPPGEKRFAPSVIGSSHHVVIKPDAQAANDADSSPSPNNSALHRPNDTALNQTKEETPQGQMANLDILDSCEGAINNQALQSGTGASADDGRALIDGSDQPADHVVAVVAAIESTANPCDDERATAPNDGARAAQATHHSDDDDASLAATKNNTEGSITILPIVEAKVSESTFHSSQRSNLNKLHTEESQSTTKVSEGYFRQRKRTISRRSQLSPNQKSKLLFDGYPNGLVEELSGVKEKYPIRFWLVESSSSMLKTDCKKMTILQSEKMTVSGSTRWQELQHCLEEHARLAGALDFSTIFFKFNELNDIAIADQTPPKQLNSEVQQAIESINQSEPPQKFIASLPLTELRVQIADIDEQLRKQLQNAVAVLVTDRLPTKAKDFLETMQSFESLNVRIVIRLSSSEKKVVEFYKRLCTSRVEVIGTFIEEALAVHSMNPFLNYAHPLHLIREMGLYRRFLTALSERPLDVDELRELLVMLFGKTVMIQAPDIGTNFAEFRTFLHKVNQNHGKQWNPMTKKTEFWIDMRQLSKMYSSGSWVKRVISRRIVAKQESRLAEL